MTREEVKCGLGLFLLCVVEQDSQLKWFRGARSVLVATYRHLDFCKYFSFHLVLDQTAPHTSAALRPSGNLRSAA